jgi:hypothetical protein
VVTDVCGPPINKLSDAQEVRSPKTIAYCYRDGESDPGWQSLSVRERPFCAECGPAPGVSGCKHLADDGPAHRSYAGGEKKGHELTRRRIVRPRARARVVRLEDGVPVQQAAKFELDQSQAAKPLGLTIPQSLLVVRRRADRVGNSEDRACCACSGPELARGRPWSAARHRGSLLGDDRHLVGWSRPICIARPALSRLRPLDHCADALRVDGLAALVAVAGIFQPGADFAVA